MTTTAAGGIHQGPTSYGDPGFSRFVRSVFLASAGYDETDTNRPIIGVGHSISDFTPCHRDMPALLDAVCRGVVEAGGLPMAFPTTSLGEVFLDPTSMMFRNLLALEVEELLRAQPMDAAVLLGGCDKTVPGHLMGAVSAGRPVLEVVAGPMIASRWRGERIGACTDCRRLWGRPPGRRCERGRDPGGHGGARPDRRHLHGHGDRLDNGHHGRGSRSGRAPDRPPRRRPAGTASGPAAARGAGSSRWSARR